MSVHSIADSRGYYHRLMQPIPGDHPCGLSLEYDSAFLMLQTKLQPKLTAEYGNFVEVAEPTNWTDTERKCLELLGKARDIRLLIILMRCRMRQIGVSAVQEGLEALLWCLSTWPDDLHPQLLDEGEFEPFMRANAFAELDDIDGFIADFRNQPLPKAAGMQISVKELEKAHSFPREEGALEKATLEAIEHDWQARSDNAILSLQKAYALLLELTTRLSHSLGDVTPDFVRLTAVLRLFGGSNMADIAPIAAFETPEYITATEATEVYTTAPEWQPEEIVTAVSVPTDTATPTYPPAPHMSPLQSPPPIAVAAQVPIAPKGIQNRADALSRLIEVRQWFATTEPSSPVIALLSFSEKTIGKSFGELLQIIPPELISKLDAGQE
ncbi:ImpA family type VI secretion system protein [Yersinia enterocolitica]|uniref:type VI secretion system protein TssA n=1 Tax=Yersinia enterocolitica TaxID=630 RepID=UPI0005DD8AD1|nr:type VI secretion system ImpA family N-terminal domain-containing protein [Yersinia enterocolitica]CQJ18026.1 protein ImpA [Yersinia enterocolitica]